MSSKFYYFRVPGPDENRAQGSGSSLRESYFRLEIIE
jgi:hypothetical protein